MTIIIEDSEEVICSHCAQMRKTFIMIAVSAVLPMVVFSAVLLILTAEKTGSEFEDATSVIVEFVLGLLYVQLFVATSVLIIGFLKRRHPIMKYQVWYLTFHVVSMALFLGSSFTMTFINDSYFLSIIVLIAGGVYFYILYYFVKVKKFAWTILRRAY